MVCTNWQRWSPRGYILKSLALATKPQVLENCPVLGSRTALFFELLKFCRSRKKLFWRPYFLENTCACVLGPWPRAFLSLASRVSVLDSTSANWRHLKYLKVSQDLKKYIDEYALCICSTTVVSLRSIYTNVPIKPSAPSVVNLQHYFKSFCSENVCFKSDSFACFTGIRAELIQKTQNAFWFLCYLNPKKEAKIGH